MYWVAVLCSFPLDGRWSSVSPAGGVHHPLELRGAMETSSRTAEIIFEKGSKIRVVFDTPLAVSETPIEMGFAGSRIYTPFLTPTQTSYLFGFHVQGGE